MKKLVLIWSISLANIAFADDFGRLKLVFPVGNWVTIQTKDTAFNYTGSESGQIAQLQTTRALIDKNRQLLALVVIQGGGYGLSNVVMTYSDSCKKKNTEYLVDATGGSYQRLDCLRVWKSILTEPYIKHTPAIHAELIQMGLQLEPNSYFMTHNLGTPNGTHTFVTALIAHNVLKNIPDAESGAKYAGMPGVAWGHLFADAVRSSTRTLSGELVVPQIDYR